MPGMAGAKEAYGISVIKEDHSITIPPKALERYELKNNDSVLLTSTRINERGLSILNREKAYASVFKKIIDKIEIPDTIVREKKRTFALTKIVQEKIFLNDELLQAFHLKQGDKLIVIKSTSLSMSFTAVEIWKDKFEKRGFPEAVRNMKKLKEY
jgi:hypothetical protein